MEALLARLIKQRLLICIVFLLVVIAGIFAIRTLPIDAFPDLTNVQVEIITNAAGFAPVETEQLVTIPLESMMQGLPHVRQIRSISKFGLSVITVVFEDQVNTYFARQLVNERLQSARSRLPQGVDPELGPITTGMGEIYQYVVEGKAYSPMDLKTIHDWDIKYQLRTVPGVNEVNSWGGFTQEYQVNVDPSRLQQFNLTLDDVFKALQSNNANFSGGIIKQGAEQQVIMGVGRIHSLEDIGNIIVKYQDNIPIFIQNIAQVSLGHTLRQGAVTKDGHGEVVTGLVMMLKGENSRAVIQRVKDKIRDISKSLPVGISIRPFYDQTHLVDQTVHTITTNLVEGGMLVILVLLLLLGNLRAALIVAAVIPISMMFSFIGMKTMGITANIMSLGAIDFGMIVDGAIVMVENTIRRLSHNQDGDLPLMNVVQASLKEMAKPILFGVLIITVVYMPILTMEGIEYKMFSPMVFTVCFALLGSLACALILVPVLCTFFLKGKVQDKENALIHRLRGPYIRLLDRAIFHRRRTLGIALVAFVIAISSIPFLGTEFVPELDEGDILIETRNLPSISLSEAINVSTRIEQIVKAYPEVKTVVSKTGRPDLATDPMGVYQTDVYVILKPKSQWPDGMTKPKLVAALSQRLNRDAPGSSFNFTQPIAMRVNEVVSGVRTDVAIKLFGDNLDILKQKANQIESLIRSIPGIADLQVEKLSGTSQLVITPDRLAMARYGVNMSDIRTVIQTVVLGTPVSEVLDGRKRFTLRVRYPESTPMNEAAIGKLLIQTQNGQRIPLAQIAQIAQQEGVEVVNREQGQRRVIVQFNVRNRDPGSVVKEAQNVINRRLALPVGYTIQWGGQFENQQRAMKKLALVLPLSILIIFVLLMATFSSVSLSLLVMTNVPFALIGGVASLWLRGMYLNVPASIGFIALFGVAILNGLVLISTINREVERGLDVRTAVRVGAEKRLRPVLMTALVATLGFLPMAVSTSAGAEVQKPLATVIIGGLVTSTLLTLVVLPVMYYWLNPTHKE